MIFHYMVRRVAIKVSGVTIGAIIQKGCVFNIKQHPFQHFTLLLHQPFDNNTPIYISYIKLNKLNFDGFNAI